MDVVVFRVLVVQWLVVVYAKDCTIHTDCNSCLDDWPCEWCRSSSTCVYFSDLDCSIHDLVIASFDCPLKPGAIAGIVVGVLVGVGCICALCIFFVRRARMMGKVYREETSRLNVPPVWPQEAYNTVPIPQGNTVPITQGNTVPITNPYEGYAQYDSDSGLH
eukprot:TRINITY_DN25523_c0_g1_i1.p1 TRINITY_DN25523_c0_g1~~TRINITY_DN25523_c0_g1_i1.p1  ORF type:complete len:162 (-),score=9.40 TRINITY_DN25523_c0_g1_i1:19-504(-)